MDIKEYIGSGVLEAYVLGALSLQEQALLEANIAQFPELEQELRAIENAMLRYSESFAKEPPPALRDKIWAAVQTAPNVGNVYDEHLKVTKLIPLQPRQNKPVQWKYAAMILVLIGSLAFNFFSWNQAKEGKAGMLALNDQVDSLKIEQVRMGLLLGKYREEKNMMADTGMQTIVMHTVLKGHPMAATLYWSKDKGEAYVTIDGLPEPPKGMQYQLWAIQEGKPVDMGVLPNSMANTPAIQKVGKPVTNGEAFAISLEKEGGSPTPTMERIYVMGKA